MKKSFSNNKIVVSGAVIHNVMNIHFRFFLLLYGSFLYSLENNINLLFVFDLIPFLLLGPFLGKVIDQVNRKSLLIIASSIAVLLRFVTILFIILNSLNFVFLLFIVGISGLNTSFYQLSESSYFPIFINKFNLAKLNGFLFMITSLSVIIFPNISFILNQEVWVLTSLIISLILSLYSLVIFLLAPSAKEEKVMPEKTVTKNRSGIIYVFRNKSLLIALGIVLLGNFFNAPLEYLIIDYYSRRGIAERVGILLMFSGVGSFFASLLTMLWKEKIKGDLILLVSAISLMTGSLLFITFTIIFQYLGLMIISFGLSLRILYLITFRQLKTDISLLGSVNTLFKYIAFGIAPLSIYLFGFLKSHFSTQLLLAFCAIGFGIVGVLEFYTITRTKLLSLEVD